MGFFAPFDLYIILIRPQSYAFGLSNLLKQTTHHENYENGSIKVIVSSCLFHYKDLGSGGVKERFTHSKRRSQIGSHSLM